MVFNYVVILFYVIMIAIILIRSEKERFYNETQSTCHRT